MFADQPSGYARADPTPNKLPDGPPYTIYLGNLSYDATEDAIREHFAECEVTSVRLIMDRVENRPKGFAYAEFASLDGLKKALTFDNTTFQGRALKARVAEPCTF